MCCLWAEGTLYFTKPRECKGVKSKPTWEKKETPMTFYGLEKNVLKVTVHVRGVGVYI